MHKSIQSSVKRVLHTQQDIIKICCLNKERTALGMAVSRGIVDSGREIFGFTGILLSYRWDYLEGNISKGGIKTIGRDY